MPSDKKIEYTDEAMQEIYNSYDKIKEAIEEVVSNEKFVPGEDIISITASDVRNALLNLDIIQRRKTETRKLIIKFYFAFGILMITGGLFYEIIINLEIKPIQFSLVATGLLISVVSVLMMYWIKISSKGTKLDSDMQYRRTINKFSDNLIQQRMAELDDSLLQLRHSYSEQLNELTEKEEKEEK